MSHWANTLTWHTQSLGKDVTSFIAISIHPSRHSNCRFLSEVFLTSLGSEINCICLIHLCINQAWHVIACACELSQVWFFATPETVARSSVHGFFSLHIYSPGSWFPSYIFNASHSPFFLDQSSSTSHYMLVFLKLGHMSFENIMSIIVSWPSVYSPGSINHLRADASRSSLSSLACFCLHPGPFHSQMYWQSCGWPISQSPKIQ